MNETNEENKMQTLEQQLFTGCENCGSYSLQTECQLDVQGDTQTGYLLRLECRSCGQTQWTQECSEEDYQKSKLYGNK